MIRSIKLKFGRTSGSEGELIETTPITVFVGPNNSGKSRVLAEMGDFCESGRKKSTDVIFDQMIFEQYSTNEAHEILQSMSVTPKDNENVSPNYSILENKGRRYQVITSKFLDSLQKPNQFPENFCNSYLRVHSKRLTGIDRIGLSTGDQSFDLKRTPASSIQILFSNDEMRQKIRNTLYEALGYYFVIDPTEMGRLSWRLSNRPPKYVSEEKGWTPDAVDFHKAALPIDRASDGVKAFTGILSEVVAGDLKVLLVDEPEAFLHPSLSNRLGKEIAIASANTGKRMFVSTHSASFLMGVIQSGVPANIVRLTYEDGAATARVLESEKLNLLMRNPLLRSTRVIEGLFFEHVVVTEGDSDRAFYEEINERLLRFTHESGIQNCLFVNARNKHTVPSIVKPLRSLGVPAAGIVDIDVLKEGGQVWSTFLESGGLPQLERDYLAGLRTELNKKLVATGKEMKRDGGLNLLSGADREAAENLCAKLRTYGLFIVRKGELESWLPELELAGRHGPEWLISAFEKMGDDPDRESYLKPGQDDVWEFVCGIGQWLTNPNRKGIPA